MVLVLGIESTAHTFGIGIATDDGKILANINETYVPPPGSGMHPRDVAEHHVKIARNVLRRALEVSEVSIDDVDAIAFSQGPGLGPVLRVGATIARALAVRYGKPLVPVHHGVAHVEIAKLVTGLVDPLIVLISGGHTMVLAYSEGRYRVFGETLDISIGNCLDVFARELGFSMPGVPKVEELARRGSRFIELPYTVIGQDLSYSGLLSRALQLLDKIRKGELKDITIEDLCLSLVETAYYMLAEVTERALAATGKRELLITGGVARSSRLREIFTVIAEEFDVKLGIVSNEYAGDNGAMIAYTGALAYKYGITIPVEESITRQRWRIDEVPVPWVEDLIKRKTI
ncbi:MAG: N(6)-L-threonylcarbamoyladenine synthase Kae1 [Crenarchaeota archaeon]|nr:N(6)-L-threonylcarbamoyladenine synthase Kae1 [Thermoproteota archaeon]